MRTDGVFTVRETVIKLDKFRPITLIPFGDVHRDSPACCVDKWKEFIARGKACKNAFFLGMGDYMDGYSTSERRIIYSADMHESSRKREETEGRARVRMLAKEIGFMRGRMIGIMGGNHFQSYPDGTNSDHYLANLLGCQYLGACTATRIRLKTWGGSVALDVFAHHGRGGGRTAAGRFNSVEQLAAVCDADIYLMGDNHARGIIPMGERLSIVHHPKTGCEIKSRQRWIGRTGSFLRGYIDGESSYVADAALPPASLGWVEFELRPKIKDGRLVIDVSSRQ